MNSVRTGSAKESRRKSGKMAESRTVSTVSLTPLNGTNYPSWKVQCRMVLLREGLWGIGINCKVRQERTRSSRMRLNHWTTPTNCTPAKRTRFYLQREPYRSLGLLPSEQALQPRSSLQVFGRQVCSLYYCSPYLRKEACMK